MVISLYPFIIFIHKFLHFSFEQRYGILVYVCCFCSATLECTNAWLAVHTTHTAGQLSIILKSYRVKEIVSHNLFVINLIFIFNESLLLCSISKIILFFVEGVCYFLLYSRYGDKETVYMEVDFYPRYIVFGIFLVFP